MPESVLDNLDPRRLGRDLQSARKQARLTQEDAARLIDVARTTITAIESGERRIKEADLIKLAHAYGRQVSDFVRARPPVEKVEVSQAQFRGPYLRTDEDIQAIEPSVYELQELCRDYLELEEITNSPLVRKYPSEYRLGYLPVEQAAEDIALEERNRLRLGDGPVPNLRDILEADVGLRIFYMPLRPSSKFAALYLYTEDLGGCIAVNSLHPEERRRMSLSHEWGHFLTTRYKPEALVENGYQRLPESERFASLFAMHFLIPTSGLMRRFNEIVQAQGKRSVTVGLLCDLAHQYGVSVEALVNRLEMLKLVPTGTWESLKNRGIKVREIQRQLGLGEVLGRDDLLPQRYQSLAIQAFADGLITEGQLARFLHVDRIDARRIAETLESEVTPENNTENTHGAESIAGMHDA
jgi:Zn-dependent peptidase ImmA (M78 family)/DNA-binding XRE family transcriptional regulator